MQPIKLGILGSTRGTDLQAIIDAISEGDLVATLSLVVSNKEEALILERARDHQLSAIFINPVDTTREEYDHKLSEVFKAHGVDLIVLIGYMRILSVIFISHWQNKIINIHPSLLPAFAGGMDQNVHQAVLKSGIKETGCTVHFVTEAVDQGPILIQKRCPVLPGDTVETLKSRVQKLEGEALVAAIKQIGKNHE